MADQATSIDAGQLSTINILIHQLNLLLSDLLAASRATVDPTKLAQINSEMMAIQALINTAAQAQGADDDATFSQATQSLQTQAAMLNAMEAQVSKIVGDVATAGRIVGYIAQAISLIGRL